jgi:hypothetical protein
MCRFSLYLFGYVTTPSAVSQYVRMIPADVKV